MTDQSREQRLAAIEAREKAATPGPWNPRVIDESAIQVAEYDGDYKARRARIDADAIFIADAREDVPWLLERNAELAAEVERLQAAARSVKHQIDASNEHLRSLAQKVIDGDAEGALRSARAALCGVRPAELAAKDEALARVTADRDALAQHAAASDAAIKSLYEQLVAERKYSAELERRMVANAGSARNERAPRWIHVSRATGFGSTRAQELCRSVGFDPDEMVGGDGAAERVLVDAAELKALREDAANWRDPIAALNRKLEALSKAKAPPPSADTGEREP